MHVLCFNSSSHFLWWFQWNLFHLQNVAVLVDGAYMRKAFWGLLYLSVYSEYIHFFSFIAATIGMWAARTSYLGEKCLVWCCLPQRELILCQSCDSAKPGAGDITKGLWVKAKREKSISILLSIYFTFIGKIDLLDWRKLIWFITYKTGVG